MIGKLKIRMQVGLHGALFMLEEQARAMPDGGRALAELQACARVVPNAKVVLEIPAIDLLCAACDTMREQENGHAVATLERLIVTLKAGKKRRVIGTFHTAPVQSIGELDDRLELIRKLAKGKLDG